MSLNLHHIVRSAINYNFADQEFKIYRSLGQKNIDGIMQAQYAPAESITGNFQSEGDATLDHANLAGQNTITRKLYVYASSSWLERPYTVFRPLARTGDYIQDPDGYYWLVSAVIEDFSHAGWESLRCVMQQDDLQINIVDPVEEENNAGK